MIKKLLTILFYILVLGISPAFAYAATLSLSPASGTFNRGCQYNAEIKLDTSGVQTDGTDAIVIFDASKFTASVANGTIYSDYPGTNADNEAGKVTVSGLASVSSAFSGTGTLATINFTVKDTAATGATIAKFDFDSSDPSKTTDSNVVERGTVQDVLKSVTNGNYTIGTGTCAGATPTPTPAPVTVLPGTGQGAVIVATPTPQPKTIDQIVDRTGQGTGTTELTMTIAIMGSILTVLGILGLTLL